MLILADITSSASFLIMIEKKTTEGMNIKNCPLSYDYYCYKITHAIIFRAWVLKSVSIRQAFKSSFKVLTSKCILFICLSCFIMTDIIYSSQNGRMRTLLKTLEKIKSSCKRWHSYSICKYLLFDLPPTLWLVDMAIFIR